MTFKDKPEWDKFAEANAGSGYGEAILGYAEKWADTMEARLANGETVEQCAKTTSQEADTDGITGFMYGCAVNTLARTWAHGEELRRWHNKATQIGTEGDEANETGGVLNPAVMCVGAS